MIPWPLPAKCIQIDEQRARAKKIRKHILEPRVGQIIYEISFRIWKKLETIYDATLWLSGEKCDQKSHLP